MTNAKYIKPNSTYDALKQYLTGLPYEEKEILYKRAVENKINIDKFFETNPNKIVAAFIQEVPLPESNKKDNVSEFNNRIYELYGISLAETLLALETLSPYIKDK